MKMKRYLVLLIIAVFLASCASPKRQISRDIDQGNIQEAHEQLMLMFEEEDVKEDAEAWLLKADLYMHAFESEEPDHSAIVEDPLGKARNAIDKADELDTENMHLLEIQQKRLILSEQMFNYGLSYYEDEDFGNASEKFYISFKISEQFDSMDTMTLFNAGLAAEQAQLQEAAIKYYKRLVDLEFEEPYIFTGLSNSFIRLREDANMDIYKYDAFIKASEKENKVDSILDMDMTKREKISVISYELDLHTEIAEVVYEEKPHLFEKEKIDKIKTENDSLKDVVEEYENEAITFIKKGREQYPEDIELIFAEANFYLMTGRTAEAREVLDLAIEREPDNASLHFAFGANFEKMAEDELLSDEEREMALNEAISAYERAIEIDDEFADAYYNLGALYFNKGIRIFEQADEELRETRDFQQYQIAEQEVEELWLKAQPYLEDAKELIEPGNPSYQGIITSLLQLYARTDQNEKREEIEKEYREYFGTEDEE